QRAAQQRFSTAMLDDKDIAGVNVFLLPAAQASILMCGIALHEGAHPEESRDRVLDELSHIWRVVESADEEDFASYRRVAIMSEMIQAQDFVTRGVKRLRATHFAQDPTLYSRWLRDLTALQ